MRGRHSALFAFSGLVAVGVSLGAAPLAAAEQPNIYGVITADESREIAVSNRSICSSLQRASATAALTSSDASLLVDDYLNKGWDIESTADILTAALDRNCGQFLPQLSQALVPYTPIS
ncbi:hypothetical protein [Mycolicibacterium mengxianglii]|uniref:hypothetical protein n=1 Tax=Mycolicibacterium mengxianglii TaxID=2736649 RepID=UPI0018EEE99A|nr:hypothetical protein [Mycolicibacterium mengxianglii]